MSCSGSVVAKIVLEPSKSLSTTSTGMTPF
jgi:hypothetical protein